MLKLHLCNTSALSERAWRQCQLCQDPHRGQASGLMWRMKSIKVWDCSSIKKSSNFEKKKLSLNLAPNSVLTPTFSLKTPWQLLFLVPSLSIDPSDPAPSSGGC